MSRGRSIAGWLLGALTALAASGTAALVRGQPLLRPAQPLTFTEAIGMHDTAEIVRQLAPSALLTADNAAVPHGFAVQENASGIAAYIAERYPPPDSCSGVPLPW